VVAHDIRAKAPRGDAELPGRREPPAGGQPRLPRDALQSRLPDAAEPCRLVSSRAPGRDGIAHSSGRSPIAIRTRPNSRGRCGAWRSSAERTCVRV
jgi:hypothetical protein